MAINNFEINSTYPSQQPESHTGKLILVLVILALAGFLYYTFKMNNKEVPPAPQPVVETQQEVVPEPAPVLEEISIDDLSANINAAFESDASDLSAIDAEFK
ncbi:MAG: hypothetical protein FGM57_02065 [Candidatus Taylorbacteria bacterium]|nr:hypothetical protein [Candidatus Taylorbacteria bacterium]